MQRHADQVFANEVKVRVDNQLMGEKELEMKRQQDKANYYKDITTQIKTEKQRKKYDILMTEHERRVNDRDIEAYREFDTQRIDPNGVPALG